MTTHSHWWRPLGLLFWPVALGCAQVSETQHQVVETPGLVGIIGHVHRGDLTYEARGTPDAVHLELEAWGQGMTRGQAARRAEKVEWSVRYRDNWLETDVTARPRKAGGDLWIQGPDWVHLDLIAVDGAVEMIGADGVHVITAHRVTGRGIIGAVDLFSAREGVDLAFWPAAGTESIIEAHLGDAYLYLPQGGDYTVEAYIDPRYGALFDVPGLIVESHIGDRIVAVSGTGDALITVVAVDGEVRVLPAAAGEFAR